MWTNAVGCEMAKEERRRFLKRWYTDLRDRMTTYLASIKERMKNLEEKEVREPSSEERLLYYSLLHMSEFTQRIQEIDGMDLGVRLPSPEEITSLKTEREYALANAIQRHWSKAVLAYAWGTFSECVIHAAGMVKGGLVLAIYRDNMEETFERLQEGSPSLEQILSFCENEGFLQSEMIKRGRRVSHFINEHLQSLLETDPEAILETSKGDEFIPLTEFQGHPPIHIDESGIRGENTNFIVDGREGKPGFLYKYKMDAKKCINTAKDLIQELFGG